ncbi:MAG: 50S ribosomal protein L4 [Clostridia bacterium]|nr:50S ribosomal protein L4 [Clostridia bacterium]
MAKIDIFNIQGEVVGKMDLSKDVFGVDINTFAVHQVVRNYLNNQRQGTQSTLTRSEVSGGGKKPWRQKGTGRARQGSTRSPQWYKGGVVFAPKPRGYGFSVNKKIRRLALKSALTDKLKGKNIIVLDELSFDAPKTKDMIAVLEALKVSTKALIVTENAEKNVYLSARNIEGVDTTTTGTLNVYDILNHDKFIITKAAAEKVQEVYA